MLLWRLGVRVFISGRMIWVGNQVNLMLASNSVTELS